MASNKGYSSPSEIKSSLNHGSLQTDYLAPIVLLYLLCMDQVENPISNSTTIVEHRFVAVEICLLSRCLETALVYLWLLHSNGSTCYNNFRFVKCFYIPNSISAVKNHMHSIIPEQEKAKNVNCLTWPMDE
jgi:hypothetical protein